MKEIKEEWKQIKGYEGIYKISNYGNVLREYTIGKRGTGNYKRNQHILKKYEINKGYYTVHLYKNNKREIILVHRLVAIAFIDNKHPEIKKEVNHIDCNRKNNFYLNLEWVTHKENMNHNNCTHNIGKRNSKPVIQYDKNNNMIKKYLSALDAERETGISNGMISECVNGKRKSAGGFIWKR